MESCVSVLIIGSSTKRTIRDSYALPRINELLDNLIGAKYFSSLDLRSGYYQVEIEEEHKSRTAFTVGPLGFYQFERIPFGLTNAPATFQRLMEKCMGDLHMKECSTFIDDVIVAGSSFEEELLRLEHVFPKLIKCNLKLNLDKCAFFRKQLIYCGHVVSEEGVEPDPDKAVKVKSWSRPANGEQVRGFLGFAEYYRWCVRNFARIPKPLNDLMGGFDNRKRKKRGNRSPGSRSRAEQWRWVRNSKVPLMP